jgi:hypothetical protein
MAVKTLQITQTGSVVHCAPIGTFARWISFQNNAGNVMRLGGANVSATLGISVPPASGNFVPPSGESGSHADLGQWYTIGTNADLLDVVYDAMN